MKTESDSMKCPVCGATSNVNEWPWRIYTERDGRRILKGKCPKCSAEKIFWTI